MKDAGRTGKATITEVVLSLVVLTASLAAFVVLGPMEGILVGVGGAGIAWLAHAVSSPPEPKPPPPEPASPENPIDWIVEHDAHRYDPGYWTGGRLNPLLRAPRANRYGVYLIVGSFLTLIVAAFVATPEWGGTFLLMVVGSAAALAAGWALVKRGPR